MIEFIVYFSIFSTAFIGVLIVLFEKNKSSKHIFPYLITAASGSFTAAFSHLFFHSKEYISNPVSLSLFAIAGYSAFFLLNIVFKNYHHHHGTDKNSCTKSNENIDFKRITIGDFMHNAVDGMILASTLMVSKLAALAVAAGIFLHELVMQTSQFILLKASGLSNKKAILYSLISQSSIFLGGAIAYVGYMYYKNAIPAMIAITTGAFAYIIFNDLLPHIYKTLKKSNRFQTIMHSAVFLLGFIVIFAVRKMFEV